MGVPGFIICLQVVVLCVRAGWVSSVLLYFDSWVLKIVQSLHGWTKQNNEVSHISGSACPSCLKFIRCT